MVTNRRQSVVVCLSAIVVAGGLAGCVRRTLTITTTPSNALVFLNDQEIGKSEVSTDFLWYGDYDVVIRKEGYTTLKTNWLIEEPWYQVVPIDFFFEVLWPVTIHDVHTKHFALTEAATPTSDELIERANAVRDEAMIAIPSTSPN
ncbi:MAG: PEGA domain-containing protein [Planctomycetota bacterium]|jgi:hypothetical protein